MRSEATTFRDDAELRQNFLRHFHGLGALLHFPDSVFEELRNLAEWKFLESMHVVHPEYCLGNQAT